MEGVPFVGNDACAHNLLLKGRPLIMRLPQLTSGLPDNQDLCNDVRAYTLRSANQELAPSLRHPASNF